MFGFYRFFFLKREHQNGHFSVFKYSDQTNLKPSSILKKNLYYKIGKRQQNKIDDIMEKRGKGR